MTVNTDIKVSALPSTNSLSNTDLFVVTRNLSGTPTSNSVSFLSLVRGVGGAIPGPYANDADASTANVAIKSLYYTSVGTIQIRLT